MKNVKILGKRSPFGHTGFLGKNRHTVMGILSHWPCLMLIRYSEYGGRCILELNILEVEYTQFLYEFLKKTSTNIPSNKHIELLTNEKYQNEF